MPLEYSIYNVEFCTILATFANISFATGCACFHINRHTDKNKFMYFGIGVLCTICATFSSQISLTAVSMSVFGVLRVLKIPVCFFILHMSGHINCTLVQFLLLISTIGLACATVMAAETYERESGDRKWMELLEHNLATQIWVIVSFVVGVFGFLYTVWSKRPEPLRALSLYNLAFPVSGICVSAAIDAFAKIAMEEIASRPIRTWEWILIAVGCIVAMSFAVWYVEFMYGRLHVESIIPLHTVGLIVGPIMSGFFILGEELKTPTQFFICLGLITTNLLIFFMLAPASDHVAVGANPHPEIAHITQKESHLLNDGENQKITVI